jgi:hypothetical protein
MKGRKKDIAAQFGIPPNTLLTIFKKKDTLKKSKTMMVAVNAKRRNRCV